MYIKNLNKSYFSIQRFIDINRHTIEPLKYLDELKYKQGLIRNSNEYHSEFIRTYGKYQFLLEEMESLQYKQSSFYTDIQNIAESKFRPDKAEKQFQKRDKQQVKLQKFASDKVVTQKQIERSLFDAYLKFNNHIVSLDPELKTHIKRNWNPLKPTNNQKFQSFQKDQQTPVHLPNQLKFIDKLNNQMQNEKINIYPQVTSDFNQYIGKSNKFLSYLKFESNLGLIYHQNIEQKDNYSNLKGQFYESFQIRKSVQQTLQAQKQIMLFIKKELNILYPSVNCELWEIDQRNLHPIEASRIELTADYPTLQNQRMIVSCSNLIDHISLRHNRKDEFIVITQIPNIKMMIDMFHS